MLKVIQAHFNDVDLALHACKWRWQPAGLVTWISICFRETKGKMSHRKRGRRMISHNTMPSCSLFVPQYGE